jgi:ubiquinone/menaquinone biosynthesis C-methylase UbiE
VAWLYDPLIEKLSFGRERRFREKTLQCMDFLPTDRILDVGCGTGSLTLLVAERLEAPGEIIGIDAAPRMIDIARRKARNRNLPISFRQGYSESLEFPDSYFDIVINSMFTHHIDSELKKLSFNEMGRVLKPGKCLVTADIDRPSTPLSAIIGWTSRYLLMQKELEDNLKGLLPLYMKEAGFVDVKKLDHIYGLVSFFKCRKPE